MQGKKDTHTYIMDFSRVKTPTISQQHIFLYPPPDARWAHSMTVSNHYLLLFQALKKDYERGRHLAALSDRKKIAVLPSRKEEEKVSENKQISLCEESWKCFWG